MTDNTQVNNGSGDIIRDIDRGGVKTQVVQIDIGGASGEVLASTSNPVPVVAAALPLPTGAAIAALQPAINADGGSQTHVMNFPATQPVSAAALPLPTGAGTAANQATIITALAANHSDEVQLHTDIATTLHADLIAPTPAGTNSIGTVQPGNTPNTTPWLVQEPDGSNASAVGGTGNASQSAAGVLFSVDTSAYNAISLQVTSAGVGCTVTYECSNDNVTWVLNAIISNSAGGTSASPTTTTTAGMWSAPVSARYFRARVSTYGSGTVTIYYALRRNWSPGNMPVSASYMLQAGSVASATVESGGSSSNPVKIATKFNATLPTFTDGQRADAQSDVNGRQLVNQPDAGVDSTGTGNASVAAAATIFSLDTSGYNGISVQVTSAGVGCTITYESSNDNATWTLTPGFNFGTGTPSQFGGVFTSTAVNLYTFPITGRYFRARVSTYGSGTVTVYYAMRRTYNSYASFVTGSGNVQIVGTVQSGSTDSTGPVKIGTKFNATLPTFTDGQRADMQSDTNGRLLTNSPDAGVDSTGTGNASQSAAATLFSLDTSGYNGISVQVTSAGVGCVISYEGSNDNSNWVSVNGFQTNAGGTSSATQGSSVAVALIFALGLRYYRARVSTYGSGTVTVFYALRRQYNSSLTPISGSLGTPTPVQVIPNNSSGWSYVHVPAGQATTVIKASAGTLHSITYNSKATASNTTNIYDNATGAGTVIAVPDVVNVNPGQTSIMDIAFAAGLTIITATANGGDMTIAYK